MNDIEILENYLKYIKQFDNNSDFIPALENLIQRNKELEEIKERYLKLESDRFGDNVIPKSLIEEEINRLKYDVSKIKEIKQTRYSDYDRIRLKAYVTKSNEIIKRLEKCVNKR